MTLPQPLLEGRRILVTGAAFPAGPGARFIAGQLITVDGGLAMVGG